MACLHWLEAEIAPLRPRAIVALGATAARSLLGRAVGVTGERGPLVGARRRRPRAGVPASGGHPARRAVATVGTAGAVDRRPPHGQPAGVGRRRRRTGWPNCATPWRPRSSTRNRARGSRRSRLPGRRRQRDLGRRPRRTRISARRSRGASSHTSSTALQTTDNRRLANGRRTPHDRLEWLAETRDGRSAAGRRVRRRARRLPAPDARRLSRGPALMVALGLILPVWEASASLHLIKDVALPAGREDGAPEHLRARARGRLGEGRR